MIEVSFFVMLVGRMGIAIWILIEIKYRKEMRFVYSLYIEVCFEIDIYILVIIVGCEVSIYVNILVKDCIRGGLIRNVDNSIFVRWNSFI